MLVRRETPADVEAIRDVHVSGFAAAGQPTDAREPVEARLVEDLRADPDAWLPELSLVAESPDGVVVGHVVCSRARIGEANVLGLGPIGVLADRQRQGVGHALMHAVLGAADALGEPLVVLLGHADYYPLFGFRPAAEYGIVPPVAEWAPHFQVRTLAAYDPAVRGTFAYARPFDDL